MTFLIIAVIVILPIAFIVSLFSLIFSVRGGRIIPAIGVICALIAFVILVNNPTVEKVIKERAAETAYQSHPHLYSKEGECEVYEFIGNDGHYHYFTKCANSKTITTTTIQEGKSSRQEEITTQ